MLFFLFLFFTNHRRGVLSRSPKQFWRNPFERPQNMITCLGTTRKSRNKSLRASPSIALWTAMHFVFVWTSPPRIVAKKRRENEEAGNSGSLGRTTSARGDGHEPRVPSGEILARRWASLDRWPTTWTCEKRSWRHFRKDGIQMSPKDLFVCVCVCGGGRLKNKNLKFS